MNLNDTFGPPFKSGATIPVKLGSSPNQKTQSSFAVARLLSLSCNFWLTCGMPLQEQSMSCDKANEKEDRTGSSTGLLHEVLWLTYFRHLSPQRSV